MPRFPIIGLCGGIGAGKDTLAKHLVEHHGYTKYAFADPMREIMAMLNPVIDRGNGQFRRYNDLIEEFGYEYVKRNHPEVRRYLQTIGEEAGRQVHGEDCWIKITERRIAQGNQRVVLSDVRYLNEAQVVKSRGGIIIQLCSEDLEHSTHVSERAIDKNSVADYVIHNIRGTRQMYDVVDQILLG